MVEREMAHVPQGSVPVPAKIAEIAGDDAVDGVWRNQLGGLTFRLRGQEATRYAKWQSYSGLNPERKEHVNLSVEAEKLSWAGQFARVPSVLEQGAEGDAAWLITEGINAPSAADPRWRDAPEAAVRAIATGLRRLHDALPVDECSYQGSWLGAKATTAPAPERLVVCHGDPCVPNTLIDEDGGFAGHVDLAQLGVADLWADLAIATYSISWQVNFGHNYDDLFFDTYGVQPDYERIHAYRKLWDAE